jgi:hypothetical protein
MGEGREGVSLQLRGLELAVDELHEPDALAELLVGRLRQDEAPVALVQHAEALEEEVRLWRIESG